MRGGHLTRKASPIAALPQGHTVTKWNVIALLLIVCHTVGRGCPAHTEGNGFLNAENTHVACLPEPRSPVRWVIGGLHCAYVRPEGIGYVIEMIFYCQFAGWVFPSDFTGVSPTQAGRKVQSNLKFGLFLWIANSLPLAWYVCVWRADHVQGDLRLMHRKYWKYNVLPFIITIFPYSRWTSCVSNINNKTLNMKRMWNIVCWSLATIIIQC